MIRISAESTLTKLKEIIEIYFPLRRHGKRIRRAGGQTGDPSVKYEGLAFRGFNKNLPLYYAILVPSIIFKLNKTSNNHVLPQVPTQTSLLDGHYRGPLVPGPISPPCPSKPAFSSHQLSSEPKQTSSSNKLAMLSFLRLLTLNSQAISALDEVPPNLLRNFPKAMPS
jgi:hypothetical protein